jgi:metal-dependent amidase/aminoacylase/carboxypeptidase family protein
VLDAIRTHQDATRQVFETVLAHPELGHEEYATAAYLCDRLGDAGLEVEPGVAGMPTAFRARLSSGRTGRTVGLVMLYDAVPSLTADGGIVPVHSCGHPAIAAGVWAAARALAAIREVLGGDVVVIGCPADEIHAPKTRELGGGKTLTAERGVWDDIDAALYVHPEFINTVSTRSLWMRRDRLRVSGVRSLRPGNSQAALDALSELTAAVREHDPSRLVLEHLELDGDVEESTGLILGAEVLFFGHDEAELTSTSDAVRARIRGGTWSETPTVHGIRPDDTITAAVADAFRRLGKDFVADPPPLPFATDFGEISRRVPSALIGVGRPGGWSFHTAEGAREFASADAMDCALDIARVLALTVVRLTRA